MLTEAMRERINRLSTVKRQLLEQRLRHDAGSNQSIIDPGAHAADSFMAGASVPSPFAGGVSMPGVSIPGGFASGASPTCAAASSAFPSLSFTQAAIWRTQAAHPQAVFLNYPQLFRLHGPLDFAALEGALRLLHARHDALRTTVATAGGVARAVVSGARTAAASYSLRCVELPQRLSAPFHLQELLHQHQRQPFDLQCDAPLSALLIREGTDRHTLSLVHHAWGFDPWSLSLFNRELRRCYDDIHKGVTPRLPPLPFAYADYAAWQHSPANAQRLAAMSHYWRWQLARPLPAMAPTHGRPLRGPLSYSADSFEFCVRASTLQRLEAIARRENATLFMLLLSSLHALLGRYSHLEEIGIGTVVANRQPSETESLLGNFTNLLVLRGSLAGNPSFRQLLRRVRGVTLNAYARQEVPLAPLMDELRRTAGVSSPFHARFDYINEPLAAPAFDGLDVTRLPALTQEIEHPLQITAQLTHDHLRIRLQARTDCQIQTSVQQMACHWNTLLSAIADNPELPIDSLPLSRHPSRHLAASEWPPAVGITF
jgi:hypothetical protein